MRKNPDLITTEYYNGSSWVDISSYVVSRTNGNQGFENAFDRVAYLGLLELELDNKDGLFMPMGGDAAKGLPTLTGFNKGAKIRVRVVVGTHNKVIWIGRIDSLEADDKNTEPNRVKLLALDWFDVATRFPMKGSDILLDKNLSQAMIALLARVSIQPESTNIDTGLNTFPAVFEDVKEKTKAIAEINKLTLSELGYTYLLMDGTLRVEDSSARKGTRALDKVPLYPDLLTNLLLLDGDDFLLLDGDTLLIDESEDAQLSTSAEKLEIKLENSVINRADIRVYPVRTDTSLVDVFRLGSPIRVPAGQTVIFTGHYTNPNGGENIQATNQQPSTATTDYLMYVNEDGTGTNLTANLSVTEVYYGDVVEYSLNNTGGTDGWVTFLRARGYGIYYDTPISDIYEDINSIDSQGETVFEMDQKYKRDLWEAIVFSKSTVEEYKKPKLRIISARFNANLNSSHLMAFLYLDVGSLISIKEIKSGITKHYYILSRNFTIDAGKNISVVYGLKENLSYLSGTLTPITLEIGEHQIDGLNYGPISKVYSMPKRSISAWVYPRTVDGRIVYTIADNALGGFSFALGGTNRLQLYEKETGSLGSWDTDNNSITSSGWHHLAVTRDRSIDPATDPIIYIDGVVAHITETSTPTGNIAVEQGLNLRIGSNASNGEIKDVRIYDRILASGEIVTIYSGGAYAHVMEDDMVFQSHFLNTDLGTTVSGVVPAGESTFDNIYKAVGILVITPVENRAWTLRTTPNNQYYSVAWSPVLKMFAACGDTGANARIMTSPNGKDSWTLRTTPSSAYYAICWGNGLFVAVGNNVILTSPDGITWTSRTSPSNRDWRGIVWSQTLGKFVAVSTYNAGAGVTSYMTSTDGINWTSGTIVSGVNISFKDIAYGNGVLVACGYSASSVQDIYISTDGGTTWTAKGVQNNNRYGVTYSPELNLFVTVGDGTGLSDQIFTSTDGNIWTARSSPTFNSWKAITWASELGIFMAIASDGTDFRSMYSTDGITWTWIITAANYGWYGICYSPDLYRFVAVQYNTSNTTRVMTL